DEQQLLIRAEYSDDSWRDVTWLAKFDTNDAAVAEVDSFGKVRIRRQGETAIRITFQGQVGVVIFTVPFEQPVSESLFAQRNNFIDDFVYRKLAALRIPPADLC